MSISVSFALLSFSIFIHVCSVYLSQVFQFDSLFIAVYWIMSPQILRLNSNLQSENTFWRKLSLNEVLRVGP